MRITITIDDRDLPEFARHLAPHLPSQAPAGAAPAVRLLAAGEVAKLIGLPSRKALEMRLVRARKRGELHDLERLAVHVDGSRRWPSDAIATWIRGQR